MNKYLSTLQEVLFDEDFIFFNSKEDEREVLQDFYSNCTTEWDHEPMTWKFE